MSPIDGAAALAQASSGGDELRTRHEFGEDVAVTYDDHFRGDESATFAFPEQLARAGPALELAIGTGRIALPLAARGIRVGGIDISSPIVTPYAWPSELDLMARIAGLRLNARWGGWNREPFTATTATHVSVYGRGSAG